MPKTVKKHERVGGGLECVTQLVRSQPPIFDFDRDTAVYMDVFQVPDNAVRMFSYVNEEHNIHDFNVPVQIDFVRTKFRIELGNNDYVIIGGVIQLHYSWVNSPDQKLMITLLYDDSWTLTVDGNKDDFTKYMALKTFVDNGDSRFICGAAHNVFSTIIQHYRNTDAARQTSRDEFEALMSVLQKPIVPVEFEQHNNPIPVLYVAETRRATRTSKSRSASKKASPVPIPSVGVRSKASSAGPTPMDISKSKSSAKPAPMNISRPSSAKQQTHTSPQPVKTKSKSKSKSLDLASLPIAEFVTKVMEPVPALQKCIRAHKMIVKTKNNMSLGHFLFQEMDDIFKEDAKVQEFRKHVKGNLEEYTALSHKSDRDLKNDPKWKELLDKYEAYKTRLRRVALFACHPDKLNVALNSISPDPAVVEKSKDIMKDITSTVNGQLDSQDKESVLEELSLKDYIRNNPRPKRESPPRAKPQTARKKASPSSNAKCVRDNRTCSPKAATDGRGPTKEELVQIALKHCNWDMSESEIRKLTVAQLCKRIRAAP